MVDFSLINILNVSIFAIFLGVSVIPFYVSRRLGATTLGLVSLALALFAVTHGVYHLLFVFGMFDLSIIVFGPVSAALLLVFAVYLYRRGN